MPFFFSCLSVTQDNLYNTLSYCNTKSNWRYKPSVYCVCYNPRQRYVDKISAEAASDKLIKNESLFNKFKAKKKITRCMDYQDMFLFLLCHTNTGILGYQSLPPNTRP